jgi:hypothetical protein
VSRFSASQAGQLANRLGDIELPLNLKTPPRWRVDVANPAATPRQKAIQEPFAR